MDALKKVVESENRKWRSDKLWVYRALILAFMDVLILFVSYFFGLMLRYEFVYRKIPKEYLQTYVDVMIPYVILTVVIFYLFRLYHSIWRFASISELGRIICAFMALQIDLLIAQQIFHTTMPYAFWIVGFVLSFVGCTGMRFSYRFLRVFHQMVVQKNKNYGDERVMVIGAGSAGRVLIHEMIVSNHMNAKVCCIIDDNPIKKNRFLDGIPIVGNREDIQEMVIKYSITKIVFAIPTATGKDRKEILNICQETGCEVQVIPGFYEMIDGKVSMSRLREVQIQDLLGRDEIVVDNKGIHSFIKGKVVMVTR